MDEFGVDLLAIEEEKREVAFHLFCCYLLTMILAYKDLLVDIISFETDHNTVDSKLMTIRCRLLKLYIRLLFFFDAELEIDDIGNHISEGFILEKDEFF